MLRKSFAVITFLAFLSLCEIPFQQATGSSTKTLPQGTRVYVVLEERVSGKRGESEVGQLVHCRVWRDVVVGGSVLIKAGAPVVAKIDSIKRANIAGIKGKMSIAAYETKGVDGQTVQLTGGYMKEGKSRMVLSISLGAVLAWPLIFIPGKAAELPQGMVYDSFTGPDMNIQLPPLAAVAPVIDLSGALSSFSAEVLLDNLQDEKKPEAFQIRVKGDGPPPQQLVIDSINGQTIPPLPLEIRTTKAKPEAYTILAEIRIKTLLKHFQKGINRFEVSYNEGGNRISTEVILNIQM